MATVTTCIVCEKVIKEKSSKSKGEDSIFCEGVCQGWMHRHCVGISKPAFSALNASPDPFLCTYCSNTKITELRQSIDALKNEVTSLKQQLSSGRSTSYASIVGPPSEGLHPPKVTVEKHHQALGNQNHIYERKFNVVIHGIRESNEGTPRLIREKHDNDIVLSTLSKIDSTITPHCIRDCTRLGKYNDSRNRPILIRLNSLSSVTSVLSNKKALAKLDQLSIQPDLSPEDRKKLSFLLKERRKLIESGIQRKDIKIRGSDLIVNGIKHGSTNGVEFKLANDDPLTNHPDSDIQAQSTLTDTSKSSESLSISTDK